ncbi:alanine racemase [Conexibacter stalactiti]|uniref:Alanine racemase n=1 Tax=Conexibacter stalactiti TaxID=1940611 RepID=A0ABU4HIH1_9ACTN|nr:alanine racemase [Conexibacter stalactiti]MDW5593067.1 alanine racemase [Conexibacter stalactiti]MEC5033708.1 alanine racemase [Conexibacter stalactiti]
MHIDLDAIERNCATIRAATGPLVELCAVVKADAYGHGAPAVAHAALAGGASRLAVATVDEAEELRNAGVTAPVLLLGPLTSDEIPRALRARVEVVAWRAEFLETVLGLRSVSAEPLAIHVKLDVGMGRLGVREADALEALARQIVATPALRLAGAMTHLPCADEDPERSRAQVRAFRTFGARLKSFAPDVVLHAANSAATLSLHESRLDMVRCGVALYGLDPFGRDPAHHGLRPALELCSYVAALKPIAPGESVGYGGQFVAAEPGWIATIPIGYGDGWRRAFSGRTDVLIAGCRYPIVGRVSMDSLTVDVGPGTPRIAEGDKAVLLGADGDERISAEELARRVDTINYEITTALSRRPTRNYHRGLIDVV